MQPTRTKMNMALMSAVGLLIGLGAVTAVKLAASDANVGQSALGVNKVNTSSVSEAVPHAHNVTASADTDGPISVVRDPTDLPPPIWRHGSRRLRVDLETVEVTARLADGATYHYWTFNQKVPGPFIRVRVGIGSRCA
ncbi:hypothetical protein [Allomesorhizobium camelthorni]|uniref:hypothetical protein n=1 Tax=Allomesorhizobium camelthorni TaxID=475069 RepID=UPI001FEC6676|nr:hypothetical protein [Mesorhizobium camelthorni]